MMRRFSRAGFLPAMKRVCPDGSVGDNVDLLSLNGFLWPPFSHREDSIRSTSDTSCRYGSSSQAGALPNGINLKPVNDVLLRSRSGLARLFPRDIGLFSG